MVIPIFNESGSNTSLGNTLTDANVSFLVLTPRCGEIEPTYTEGDVKHYYCTDSTGQQISDVNYYGKVMCYRLTNIRLYRYLNDNGKYDCSPICLDIISPIYYGYNDNANSKEVKLCIQDISNFYMKQQIMTIIPEKLPLDPTNIMLPGVDNIKPISEDEDATFITNDVQINNIERNGTEINPLTIACHIYSNFYLLENQD